MGAGHGRSIRAACGAGQSLAVASGSGAGGAVLLGLFGLLLVLVGRPEGDLDAAELVAALVLVSAAAAWSGPGGWATGSAWPWPA